MSVQIAVDDPTRPDVLALLTEHLDDMRATSPAESVHALDPQALLAPEITFLSARRDGTLLGCGALRTLDAGSAELKSMRTSTAARRTGVGIALLGALLDLARARGLREVFLETGSQDFFAPARTFYERSGFTPCGPFGTYRTDPSSAFYRLDLAAAHLATSGAAARVTEHRAAAQVTARRAATAGEPGTPPTD